MAAAHVDKGMCGAPENFLTPSRFPGEPPLLFVLPAARFVAVRTAPRAETNESLLSKCWRHMRAK